MAKRTLGLSIILWSELVLSLRVLMFTIPIFIDVEIQGTMKLPDLHHNFIVVLSCIAFIYFVISLVSLFGVSLYKLFHIVAAVVSCLVVFIFYKKTSSVELPYMLPAVWAIGFSCLVNFFKGEKKGKRWKSVLLVDDDETLIRIVRPILLSNGFSVLVANSGEEGLRVAKKQKPDLILLDVILPGIKGRELCRVIKSDKDIKHIPVVFLTAKDSPDDIQAELAVGAQAHLSKPVSPKELLNMVHRFIS